MRAWAVIVFTFLFAPIIVILVYSFNEGRLLVAWNQFGFGSFAAIVTKPAIRDAVVVSLQAGVISAILATVLGTMAGVALARRAGRWVPWFLVLLVLVTVTPEIVDAVALAVDIFFCARTASTQLPFCPGWSSSGRISA